MPKHHNERETFEDCKICICKILSSFKNYTVEDIDSFQDSSFQDLQSLCSLQICYIETFLLNNFSYAIDG